MKLEVMEFRLKVNESRPIRHDGKQLATSQLVDGVTVTPPTPVFLVQSWCY
jgi:hypothetical protein